MKVAILSGKGGTGKTLLSVNLSYIEKNSIYVDCDVEEPNGLLYYQINNLKEEKIYTEIPVIDHSRCIGCKKCSEFCQFNALAFIKGKIQVYDDLCHSCGGCKIVCPVNAITETDKVIGRVWSGQYEDTTVYSGEMIIGEESGVPIIDALLSKVKTDSQSVFIDSPPGNGCPVMESIKDADYCLLVAEPSIFGLHNLDMVYRLAKVFNKQIGLVINKYDGNKIIHEYADKNHIKIIGEIPMDFVMGKLNSEGKIVAKQRTYYSLFKSILDRLKSEVV